MKDKDQVILRPPKLSDYGWIIQVQKKHYATTFGWMDELRELVENIILEYISSKQVRRQACFIAEKKGQPVGCVMLVERTASEGKVRVMFVSASERRKGIGTLLMEALIQKARDIGYTSLSLRTTEQLKEARELYKKTGFCLISKSPNVTFAKGGHDEEWRIRI